MKPENHSPDSAAETTLVSFPNRAADAQPYSSCPNPTGHPVGMANRGGSVGDVGVALGVRMLAVCPAPLRGKCFPKLFNLW